MTGATRAINAGLCQTLGPNFLLLMLANINNRCPGGYFTPDTFDSFEKLCECFNSDPQLQRCLSLSAVTIGLDIPGVIDITYRIAQCCNTNTVRIIFYTSLAFLSIYILLIFNVLIYSLIFNFF